MLIYSQIEAMNNCHKVISALSPNDRSVILSRELVPREKKLLHLYLRTKQPLSLGRIAEKLEVHPVHISRLNSSLYDKIFDELEITGSEKELELLFNAGLYQQLFNEISKRIALIGYIADTKERIKCFHSYLSFIVEVPYSRAVEEYFRYVVDKMILMVPNLPLGHKEAIELTALWVRIALKPLYTQKTRKYISAQEKGLIDKLDEYAKREELRSNPFFLERLHSAYSVYYSNIAVDLDQADKSIYKAYEANRLLDTYPFPFDTKSSLGYIRRRIHYLFNLSMFNELVEYYYSWTEDEKEDIILTTVPNALTACFVSFVSLRRYTEADELVVWYEAQLDMIENPSIQQKTRLLHLRSMTQMYIQDYEGALISINEITNLNKHPSYNLGLEALNRYFECECYILLKKWKIADQTIRRTIKWYERNSDSYMRQDIDILRALLHGISYYQSRSSRSKAHWVKMMNDLRTKKDLYGSEVMVNRISTMFGFPDELLIT